MYLCIYHTLCDYYIDLYEKPGKAMAEMRKIDPDSYYVYCRGFHFSKRAKLQAFLDNMTQTQIRFYAQQSPAVLTAWFHKIAEIRRPRKIERELLEADNLRLLHRFNSGLFVV